MHNRNRRAKAARQLVGLTVPEVAERLGKGESTIRSWERDGGGSPKSAEDALRMCELYGITVEWYLKGREPMLCKKAIMSAPKMQMVELLTHLNNQQVENMVRMVESLIN